MRRTASRYGRIPLALLASLWAGTSGAQEPQGAAGAVPPEVVRAVHDAAQRYQERSAEFQDGIRDLMQRRLYEQAAAIQSQYAEAIDAQSDRERSIRDEAIRAHEAFIEKYPGGALTPQRMLRLAEMYLDRAGDEWRAENDAYREVERRFDAGEIDYLPEIPRRNYAAGIGLLKKLIEKFPDFAHRDSAHYLLGYCYVDELSRQRDDEQAFATYKALVESKPGSAFTQQAYLRLGEILFENNRFEESIPYYRQVVAGPESNEFEMGLYKLAWAYYKVDDLDAAIPRFVQLLDLSQKREEAGGEQSDLWPESLRYLAISLVDLAEDQGGGDDTIAFADEFFRRGGERKYKYEVLRQVAEILVTQARFDEAVAAYTGLMRLYPLAPGNPELQNTLIGLHRKRVPPDVAGSNRARAQLTELFKPGSPWYEANRGNREAIRLATRYIEESLEAVATDYHVQAQQTRQPGDYRQAAEKYREYLERFPYAKNAYELRWQLAESLYWGGFHEDAIQEYERLLKYPDQTYRKDAIFSIAAAHQALLTAREGEYRLTPGSAALQPLPAAGQRTEFKPIALSDLEKRFVASVDALEREVPDRPELTGMLFIAAELHYFHNHFDEARRRFWSIVERVPGRNEALLAAGLIVDSYQYEGDLAKVREVSGQLAQRELGSDRALGAERRGLFLAKEKNAFFVEAKQLSDAGRYRESAEMFYSYYQRFTDAPERDLALYNAAYGFEKLGETERSRRLYEEMLEKYPDSPQAAPTFFKIADNYERVLDLDRAIHYYERLLKTHPSDPRSADALANAAFLYNGLARYTDAARAYERYEGDYPGKPDAGALLFRAAQTWEVAKQPKEALRVYQRFLNRHGAADPSAALDAQVKVADLYEKLGNTRQARLERQKVVDLYVRESASNPSRFDPSAVNAAAKAAFGFVQEEFARIDAMKFTGQTEKDVKVLEDKAKATQEMQGRLDAFIGQYPDFEWATAALYYKGYAFQRFADSIFAAPIPKDVTSEDDIETYKDILAKQAEPLESKALELYERTLKEASGRKRNTPWVDKAREALHAINPDSYPVFKNEGLRMKQSDPRELPAPVKQVSAVGTGGTTPQLAGGAGQQEGQP